MRFILVDSDSEILEDPLDIENFIIENGLTEDEETKIKSLNIDDEIRFGGGAAPLISIIRVE